MKAILRFMVLLFAFRAESASDYRELAAWTIDLRREVEALATERETENKRLQAAWDTLVARRSELDAQLRKERMRALQLGEKHAALAARARALEKAEPRGAEILEGWLAGLRSVTEASLPFRRQERLRDIDALLDRLRAEPASASALVSHAWDATHRQIRLSRGNGFEVTDLEIEGLGTRKAEIARLGLAQMAFVTPDGAAGFAKFSRGRWTVAAAGDPEERAAAERMVAKFRSAARSGYFLVPVPATGKE